MQCRALEEKEKNKQIRRELYFTLANKIQVHILIGAVAFYINTFE